MNNEFNVNFFGEKFSSGDIYKILTEDDFENKFSFKQKLYYNLLRPILPILLRQAVQRISNKSISFKKDFIDERTVNQLLSFSSSLIESLKYLGDKDFAICLTHDVEEQEGFNFIPKIIELEQKYGFRSSWNIVPYKYKIDKGIINLIKENGFEIGIHGYNHDGLLYYSEKIFQERVPYINRALKEYDAVGFRSPQVHRNLKWLQKLDIEYDASCFDYDPFQPFPGGTGSIWPFIAGKFVELPYTLPQDHTLFIVLKQENISVWKTKTEWISRNKGIVLMLTHPDYLLNKKFLKLYEEMLDYLNNFRNNAWYCLPRELSKYWKKNFNK